MSIPAGSLDRRIRIERATNTTGALGSKIPTWDELSTVWAKVTPVSDGERFSAAGVGAEVTTRFLIRWSSQVADVGAEDRIVYPISNGRVFNIVGTKEIGRREGVEITAAAVADA